MPSQTERARGCGGGVPKVLQQKDSFRQWTVNGTGASERRVNTGRRRTPTTADVSCERGPPDSLCGSLCGGSEGTGTASRPCESNSGASTYSPRPASRKPNTGLDPGPQESSVYAEHRGTPAQTAPSRVPARTRQMSDRGTRGRGGGRLEPEDAQCFGL